MIKRVFFDFDGVLTTDKTGSVTTCKYFSDKLGIDYQELFTKMRKFDEALDCGEVSENDIWKTICEEVGFEYSPNWLYEAHVITPIDEKMMQYAIQLKDKCEIGIITDNTIERVDNIAKKNDWLDDMFDVIIISEDVKSTKKGIKIFEVAAQRANLSPHECIFIDNKQANVDSAEKAEFIGVYFDDENRNYEELEKTVSVIIDEK